MFGPLRSIGQNTMVSSLTSDTSGAANATAQKYLIKGTTEAKLGDYEEAILYYETALDHTSNNPVLLSALADAHHAKGDEATALFYAREARTHGAGRAYYQHQLAELQRDAGQPDAAIETYRTLLDQFPADTTAYRALAALQASTNRPEAALQTYNEMLEHVAPPPISIYRQILSLHRRLQNTDGIEQTLRTLLNRRPNNRSYRHRLGEHYANTGNPEAALDLLAPLAKQQPNNADLQDRVRTLSRQIGRTADVQTAPTDSTGRSARSVNALVRQAEMAYDVATGRAGGADTSALRDAERFLTRALDRSPTHEEALTLRARILEQKEEYENAARVWERVLEEHPQVPRRWSRAASAHLSAHNPEAAASIAEEGLLLFPGHAPLARIAGVAQLRSGTPEQALEYFQEALSLRSDSAASPGSTADLNSGLGMAYTQMDRPDDADSTFEEALSATPEDSRVLRRYAYSLAHRRENLDRALDLAKRAVDRAPSDALAHDTLGWVYFQRGSAGTARRHLERALEIHPASPRILEHAGDAEQALGNDKAARAYWQKALDRSPNRFSLSNKLDGAPPQ